MVKNMKLKQGEAVREFYAALPVIEEYYSVKGYRKILISIRFCNQKWDGNCER